MRALIAAWIAWTLAWSGVQAVAATPEGLWRTEDRGGIIQIEPCGAALCGRIVGMAEFAPDGSTPKDSTGRSMCGLEFIHALTETSPGAWTGAITNPEDGRRYSARLALDDQGQLHLRGYLVFSLLGSTQIWLPYAGNVTAECRMEP